MLPNKLNVQLLDAGGRTDARVELSELVIAGWTGRDKAVLQHHIDELAGLGVKPPSSTPCFYRVSAELLTTADDIQVLGKHTSGEVEFVLLSLARGLYLGVGSDHTDRKVESYDITVSKQLCAKPVAREWWRFEDVAAHWDKLVLRSYSTRDGERKLYQEGAVTAMLEPMELVRQYSGGSPLLPPGYAMFCGTLPAIGGIAGGERFEIELIDPVRNRRIEYGYRIHMLPHDD